MVPTSLQRSPRLLESLERAPVIRFDRYDYFVHPLTDGIPAVSRDLLFEAAQGLERLLPPHFDRFLTVEAMGIPLAAALTLQTGRPYLVARKRSYGLPQEVAVPYKTGYSQGTLYANDLKEGESLVIVDDVLSSGGTLRALAQAIQQGGAQLAKAVVLFNKGLDLDRLGKELGAPVEALAHLEIERGAVHVVK